MAVHIPGVTDVRRAQPEIPKFAPPKGGVPNLDDHRTRGPVGGGGVPGGLGGYSPKPSGVPILNIDELPVGGGAGRHDPYGIEPVFSGRGSKMDGSGTYEDGSVVNPGMPPTSRYDDDGGAYDDAPPRDRAIRPKAKMGYTDRDPDIGEAEEVDQGQGDEFEPGQHPLEGVPALYAQPPLPVPEEIAGKSRYVPS